MPCLDLSILNVKRFRLVLLAVVLGFINIILTTTVYMPFIGDEIYLSIVCVCFIISVNHLLLLFLSCIQENLRPVIFCEVIYHLLAAACLLGESFQFLMSTVHILNGHSCIGCGFYLTRRFCVLFIGFLCSILYAIAGMILLESRLRSGGIACSCEVRSV